ncbi:MAG: thioredoxin family protein, partial [Reyranella sp.]
MSEWCGWPIVDDAASWETAQQILTDAELSDGLPLVPPTRRRLEAMIAGVAGRSDSHGLMPPLFGDITPESIAYQCVIAGCRPAELPIVLAAAEAILEPDFNLLGIATTTGTACVALCVHGAIARQLGVNAGTNCLGPGNRANASIGRALQLSIRNVGGARSDVGDMATMGQPGKYTLCFAERNDGPFPTLTARRGLGADASAITVMGISGTAEVLPGDGEGATPEAILSPIATAMRAAIVMSGLGRKNERGEQVFLLPLEMAQKIVRHDGWD